MAILVLPTDDFVKELKRISKKQNGILSDIAKLSAQLKEPQQWVPNWHMVSIKFGRPFREQTKANQPEQE